MKIKLAILALMVLGIIVWANFEQRVVSGGKDDVVLRFWNGFTGPDGKTILALVRRFNKENRGITVRLQRMKWSTYYSKLFVANMGGRSPDIFAIHASSIERFRNAGLLRDIKEFATGQNSIALEDFSPNALDAVTRDSQILGLPFDIHMQGLFYNKDLLRESGFVNQDADAKPPADAQEFMEVLAKNTHDSNGDGRNDKWGFTFTYLRLNMMSIMWQYGGEFFNEDNTKCTLNMPENIAALEFCSDIINKYKYASMPGTEQAEGWIGFCTGKVALAFEGNYMLPQLEEMESLNFATAPLPILGKQAAAFGDSSVLCISKDIEGKELDAAWKFLKFLSDNSLEWARAGQIPVRKSLLESPQFQQMVHHKAFAAQVPYVRYMPRVSFVGEFAGEFDVAVEKALRGSATAKEALDEATENMDKVIARYARRSQVSEKLKLKN